MTQDQLLARLPKSKHLFKKDLTATGCVVLLLQGEDPLAVIDELLAHYSGIIHRIQKIREWDERAGNL